MRNESMVTGVNSVRQPGVFAKLTVIPERLRSLLEASLLRLPIGEI
jgi:hypothetical protein